MNIKDRFKEWLLDRRAKKTINKYLKVKKERDEFKETIKFIISENKNE